MSDDPRELKMVLLEDCTTEQQRGFAAILAEQCAEADRRASGHRCWLFIPNEVEYAAMKKYADNDKCPKCKEGRVVLEIFKGNLGDSLWLRCYWGRDDCDFEKSITDHDRD